MIGKRIKWFLIDHKGWVIFIFSLIISVAIIVTEIGFGKTLRLFSLPGGGESMSYLTWGGNICEHIYPLQNAGQPAVHETTYVTFSFIFLVFYLLRFIIIVPVVNLLLRDDYVEPLRTPSGVLLSDSDPGKGKKDTWTCECGKVNPAFTGTCSCGKTKREVLTRKSSSEKDGSTNKE